MDGNRRKLGVHCVKILNVVITFHFYVFCLWEREGGIVAAGLSYIIPIYCRTGFNCVFNYCVLSFASKIANLLIVFASYEAREVRYK